MSGRAILAAVAVVTSCTDAARLQTTPPWGATETVVVVPLDANGVARSSLLVIAPGAAATELTIADDALGGRLLASAWPQPPEGPELEGCAFALGEGGDPIPAGTWWQTTSLARDATVTWSRAERGVSLAITCPPRDAVCRDVDVTVIAMPPTEGHLRAVQWIDGGALIGGQNTTELDRTAVIFSATLAGAGPSRAHRLVGGQVRNLDAIGRDVYGATSRGNVFVWRVGAASVAKIAQTESLNGFWAAAPDLLLAQRTSTAAVAFVELDLAGNKRERPDFPASIRVGAVVSRDLLYMASSDGGIYRGDRSGRWVQEHVVDGDREYSALAATASIAYVARRYGSALMRTRDGRWLDIGRPAALTFPEAIGILSRDRVVLGGTVGSMGYWDGRRWCAVPGLPRLDLESISVEPDGRSLWVVGHNAGAGTAPAVAHVILPP